MLETTPYWSWWLSGLALGATMLVHWLLMGRTLSVSGRYTALIGAWRRRSSSGSVDEEALLEAMRRATAEEFGVAAQAEPTPAPAPPAAAESAVSHAIFLGSVAVGGLVAAATRGGAGAVPVLRGEQFGLLFPGDPLTAALRARGLEPSASATVLEHGMAGTDWRFVLTSDV